MCKTIAIVSNDEGSGKTTLTMALGKELARQGKHVLLIDMDPYASFAKTGGLDYAEVMLADNLKITFRDDDINDNDGVLLQAVGLDLVPSNRKLEMVIRPEYQLKDYISRIRTSYDFILLDCPPFINMLTKNALTAADSVLIPVAFRIPYLSVNVMQQLMDTIHKVQRFTNSNLKIDGIVITIDDAYANNGREFEKMLEKLHKILGADIEIIKLTPTNNNELPLPKGSGF